MTYRELYNRRLFRGWVLIWLIPVIILIFLVLGGLATTVFSAEIGGVVALATPVAYIVVLFAVSRWPSNRVLCPYCGKRVMLPTKLRFRWRFRHSLRISEDLPGFPCCGRSLDTEVAANSKV